MTSAALQIGAVVEPQDNLLAAKEFRHAELDFADTNQPLFGLKAETAERSSEALASMGIGAEGARVDTRGERFETLLPSHPLMAARTASGQNEQQRAAAAESAFTGFLEAYSHELRVDTRELGTGRVTVHDDGTVIQVYMPRKVGGIPVRGSYISGVINHGSLNLFGTHRWGDVEISLEPRVSVDDAATIAAAHMTPYDVDGNWSKDHLVLVPTSLGESYGHRLAWLVHPRLKGENAHFELMIDAHSGELLSAEDTNRYAEVKGGVLPVSNDGIVPDGVEQAGWPMPFDSIATTSGTLVTDTGGNVAATGNMTSNLSGPFIRMNDNCGAISLTQSGGIDFGTSGGDDCVTPGFGGAGNTHASRTGFYELNKIKEMARGWLPTNSWLQQQLTSNMNINLNCNAFWGGGTVNFYRSGGGCFNTGEIAGVFDHEWGHGLDDNDANPSIASPSGEGVADIYTALRLNDSCIGRNFRATACTGFGDPCLTCTGVRDIDYLQRQSGNPHDYTWSNANCGGSVHCVGAVYAEAVWSLWKRILQSAPYNYDNNTAHEIVNRMSFIGAGAVGTWFSGGPPFGGCGSSGGYLNYLAADDDDGNINNGTPHMAAIFEAFNDQQIACATPTVQDSGCAGTPTSAPTVTAIPSDKSVGLSWSPVAGTTSYSVFRTEGVFACDFGKVRLGETTGTTFTDNGLQNGRDYSYVVIPKGSNAACFGPASSCTTTTPAAGPNLAVDAGSAALAILSGDGDQFLDNCENGRLTFDVNNTGLGGLTNVRIVDVISTSHPSTAITTTFPSAVSPSSIAQGATGSGSFDFTAGGLSFNDTLTFQVEVTADELAASRFQDLSVISTESDFQNFASRTFSFEADAEGWTVVEGTFNRSSAGGGAQGTTWYEASSGGLDDQCDHIRSPVFALNATSTMSLWNQFDIEPQFTNGTWYDRANVGVYEVGSGSRTPVDPDGGRLYNASGAQGTCGTANQQGWADAATTWGESTFSSSALGAGGLTGTPIQLDVRYGTDASLNGFGFRFDQVTVTDVDFQVADGQSDSCTPGCSVDADCDDGDFCNGAETCNAGTCEAGTAPVCDDGDFCNGTESCNEATDSCDAGTAPVCDDGLFCNGTESCNEATDSCDAGTAPVCDNGAFCDGTETCNEGTDSCDAGTAPCDPSSETCDEGTNTCEPIGCTLDSECDDGAFCNGAETCDVGSGVCQAGTAPTCDDGLFCNGTETCNEGTDSCDAGTAPTCNDGLFCNGTETCNEGTDSCDAGTAPACDDGLFCNGSETCNEGTDSCDAGTAPACNDGLFCNGTETCNEGTDSCDSGTAPACDDGLFCNGSETCNEGTDSCDAGSAPCSGGQTCNETTDICEGGSNPVIWMSFRSNTAVPGVGTVADEDIVSYDEVTGTWALEFDGSDVGLGGLEISALGILPGGDLLLSFTAAGTVGGLSVDDSDIVRFTGTGGSNTSGSFSVYFDGSDVGLTSNGEDIDGIAFAANGDLIISTTGGFSGTGASGADEDLFLFTGTVGSASTSGSFTREFDGSDVGLGGNGAEDVDAAAFTSGGELLFSTVGSFSVTGLAGTDEDVVEFTGVFGNATSGTFSMRQDLSTLGIAAGEDIGSLHIVE